MRDRSASPLRDSFPELGYGVGYTARALRAGLPIARADALASALGVSTARVAKLLGVSASTLAWRRRAGMLGLAESEPTGSGGSSSERWRGLERRR